VSEISVLDPPAGVRKKAIRPRRRTRPWIALGFLAPFFVPFVLFYVAPVAYAVVQSTQVVKRVGGVFGTQVTQFGGLAQYRAVFTNDDFWSGIVRVVAFGLVQVPIMMGVALLLALVLDSRATRGGRFFRLVYFLPFAVPGVIAAIMWGSLLDPATSPFYRAGLHIDFLGPGYVFAAIANVGVWTYAGSNTVILVAALTAVPREVFDAARIDGAGALRIARSIKIPLVRPAIVFSAILNVIGTLQLITEPKVFQSLTSQITSGYTPNMLAYNAASADQYGFAAVVSVVMTVVTFIASFGFLRFVQNRGQR
jgi:multiple sugar transport system permease protein